jgi:hypothetical protein
MSTMMDGFAAYELRHLETGAFLYKTTASTEEIVKANENLRQKELPSRFFPAGDFHIPSLHGEVAQK